MFVRRALICACLVAGVVAVPLASAAVRNLAPLAPGTPAHRPPAPNADICLLGSVGNADVVGDLFPPDDVYYTLLQPVSCGVCSLTALAAVHITLEFRTPCTVPVMLGLVPVTGGPCLLPDAQHPLVPTFAADLQSSEAGITEFVVPVPDTWKLHGDAFLMVDFTSMPDSCGTPDTQPRLAFRNGCSHCQVYEYTGTLDDVCTASGGLPLMSAEVGECIVTANRPRSWGAVKLLYR